MQNELISIVVPVYNAEKFIIETLESIRFQSYENWELILVDDASNDDSVNVIKRYFADNIVLQRVLVLENETNRGPAFCRNRGIKEARGTYLTYLDADDYWYPQKLKVQYEFMKNTGCFFSFTGYEFANCEGVPSGKRVHVPETITYSQALRNTVISTITVMFNRKQIPDELLCMPESCKREDTATWWNILKHGYTAFGIDEILSVYRRHSGSHSANKIRAVWGTYQMYRCQEKMGILRSICYTTLYAFAAIRRRIR